MMKILLSNFGSIYYRIWILGFARIVLTKNVYHISLTFTVTTNNNSARGIWIDSSCIDICPRIMLKHIFGKVCGTLGHAVTLMTKIFLFGIKDIPCHYFNHSKAPSSFSVTVFSAGTGTIMAYITPS